MLGSVQIPLVKEIGTNNQAEACRADMYVPSLDCPFKYVLIVCVKIMRTAQKGRKAGLAVENISLLSIVPGILDGAQTCS